MFDEGPWKKDGWYDIDSVQGPLELVPKKRRGIVLRDDLFKFKGKMVSLRDPSYSDRIFNISSHDAAAHDDGDEEDEDHHSIPIKKLKGLSFREIFEKQWPGMRKLLFNVVDDPEERIDLQELELEVMEEMRKVVSELYDSFVKRDYPKFSKKGLPKHFNNTWSHGWC